MLSASPCDMDDVDLLRSIWFLIAVRNWLLSIHLMMIFIYSFISVFFIRHLMFDHPDHWWEKNTKSTWSAAEIQSIWIVDDNGGLQGFRPSGQMVPAEWFIAVGMAASHLHAPSVSDSLGLQQQRHCLLHRLLYGINSSLSLFLSLYLLTHTHIQRKRERWKGTVPYVHIGQPFPCLGPSSLKSDARVDRFFFPFYTEWKKNDSSLKRLCVCVLS